MNELPQLDAFTGLDWAIVVVLGVSALVSLWRGFLREAMSLAGWVLAFVAGNLFALHLAEYFADFIANRTGRYVVAWSLIFVAVLALSYTLGRLLRKAAKASGLGFADRLMGTVFGALRGALIVMALVFVARQFVPQSELTALAESELMPHVDTLLTWSTNVFEEYRDIQVPGLTI
ncbi:MAG: CvpA family protein [Pseudomonadota bacterium]